MPGGSTFTMCVNMRVQEFTEKGAFFRVKLRSEQIRDKGIFLVDLSNKGTFFTTLFIVWSNVVIFSREVFLLPWSFRDKGIILFLILWPYHAQILDLEFNL